MADMTPEKGTERVPGEEPMTARRTGDDRVPGADRETVAARETAAGREAAEGPEAAAGLGTAPGGGTTGRDPVPGRAPVPGGEADPARIPDTAGSGETGADPHGTAGSAAVPGPPGQDATGTGTRTDAPSPLLLSRDECSKFEARLRGAVTGFVDAPRDAVEEADRVVEELTSRFTEAVERRRRTLRTSWQSTDEAKPATSTDTEQLRLALRDYRELADRLLDI
ncbi:hypothetical protein [Streptomyces sp. NPDC046197]|uniref:hypothetical protein n=1 Tax=Streptomyces sp. NPDC046197 TaxID=3154337 RepID=UPI0033E13316